jgi:hypothetical protein
VGMNNGSYNITNSENGLRFNNWILMNNGSYPR